MSEAKNAMICTAQTGTNFRVLLVWQVGDTKKFQVVRGQPPKFNDRDAARKWAVDTYRDLKMITNYGEKSRWDGQVLNPEAEEKMGLQCVLSTVPTEPPASAAPAAATPPAAEQKPAAEAKPEEPKVEASAAPAPAPVPQPQPPATPPATPEKAPTKKPDLEARRAAAMAKLEDALADLIETQRAAMKSLITVANAINGLHEAEDDDDEEDQLAA